MTREEMQAKHEARDYGGVTSLEALELSCEYWHPDHHGALARSRDIGYYNCALCVHHIRVCYECVLGRHDRCVDDGSAWRAAWMTLRRDPPASDERPHVAAFRAAAEVMHATLAGLLFRAREEAGQ